MDKKTEYLRGIWSKWGLPELVSLPDAQPRSLSEIENATNDCMDFVTKNGSTMQQAYREYAENLIRIGWTASDAEEAVTAAIVQEHFL